MQYFNISRFPSPSSPILCFPIFLLFFFVSGATAQEACFEFEEGSGNTVVTGLTGMGTAATELTLPASVTTVRSGAFYGGQVATLTLDGCNPVFESGVLAGVKSTLTSVNAGNGMTAANLHTMLATLGPREVLQEVLIGGISDAATATINWTDMDAVLTSDVHVIMPAAQVRDQVFGDAKVYGRFTVSGELATFCGHASFEDDDNGNMLFYVPTEFREDNRRVYIQRVHKVLAGQGVLIHNATGTATFADLKRVETTDESYNKNMLVGVTVPTAITATAGDKTNLILYQGAFHPTSGGTIAANRAYLQIPTAQWTALGVKQLTFSFSDTETAIGDIPVSINQREGTTEVYDIAGRRAPADGKLRKGLYVRNGQKTFIR